MEVREEYGAGHTANDYHQSQDADQDDVEADTPVGDTDPAGTSCRSIRAGRGTGNLQAPPDTSLRGHMGSDHTASPLGREDRTREELECVVGTRRRSYTATTNTRAPLARGEEHDIDT
ncbi:hypothetical protein EYF80_009444 [Liparis tanakae]|uniref:Uncharacterized protein n=1 Tax=Liparis tanakae TaxID=230148 RepID=A0A4Z2IQY9_9TELE|nr:hypothetical protein EYF80_009444 [Liparis tanakae]